MSAVALAPVTVEACRWAIAANSGRHEAKRELDSLLVGAIGERFLVEQKLTKRWTWLDANPGHEKYAEREADCIATLAEYTEWSDVIRELCRELGQTGERCR